MPLISVAQDVATLITVDNFLVGSQFEFLPYDAFLEFGMTTEGVAGDWVVDVYSGQDVLLESGSISILDRAPIYPDDFSLNDVAAAGERIKVRARNGSAGTLMFFLALKITPL
ncbi:MAG: hypothetical protein V3S55_15635 [Nitrospiraceae bacterium]